MIAKKTESDSTKKNPWYKTWPFYALCVAIGVAILVMITLPGYDWRLYLLAGLAGGVIMLGLNPKLRMMKFAYFAIGIVGGFQAIDFHLQLLSPNGSLAIKSPELGNGVSIALVVLAGLALILDPLIRRESSGPIVQIDKTKIDQQTNIQNQTNIAQQTNIGTQQVIQQAKRFPGDLTSIPRINVEKDLIGRDEQLKELAEVLDNPGSSRIVLLNGMGGIGKTSMAMAYVQLNRQQYKHVAWVSQLQKDDLPSAFAQNRELIQSLGLSFTDEPLEEQFATICGALRNLDGDNLLVIDNADASTKQHTSLLPGGNWKVMVTSRQKIEQFEEFPIDRLSEEAAKQLFRKFYPQSVDESDLDALLEEIEYHTLTIELMAKTLARRYGEITVADLLKYLEDHRLDEQAIQRKVAVQHWEEIRDAKRVKLFSHLINTFAFQGLKEHTIRLLQQYSALPPQPQPIQRLRKWLQIDEEGSEAYEDSTRELMEGGWLRAVEMEQGQPGASFHRMIREVILMQHPPQYEDLRELLDTVGKLVVVDQTKDNPVEKFPWAIYGQSLLNALSAPPPPEVILPNELGLLYQDMGRYPEAAELLEKTLKADLEHFDELHPNVAIRRSNLANVYGDLGRYEEAAELLEKALQSGIDHFGEMHPTVAIRRSNLALVYKDLGRYAEAAELLEKALKADLDHFGELDPNLARSRSNLAMVYKDLGRYEEAADLLEKALKAALDHFGELHPNVAISRSNLALVYQDLGRYEEAADLLEKALMAELDHFDENHPTIAISRSNLASVYQNLGRYPEAAELLEKALKAALDHFGELHPTVAIRRSNLALVYQDLGRYQEGKEHARIALEICEVVLGQDHPNTKIVRGVFESFD